MYANFNKYLLSHVHQLVFTLFTNILQIVFMQYLMSLINGSPTLTSLPPPAVWLRIIVFNWCMSKSLKKLLNMHWNNHPYCSLMHQSTAGQKCLQFAAVIGFGNSVWSDMVSLFNVVQLRSNRALSLLQTDPCEHAMLYMTIGNIEPGIPKWSSHWDVLKGSTVLSSQTIQLFVHYVFVDCPSGHMLHITSYYAL